MFERFTDRARRVLVHAQEEARVLNHSFLGTEHILLGLLGEREGVAAKALGDLGVALPEVRRRVEATVGTGSGPASGAPPFTPRAKRVLELSLKEALQLGHNYIGTEHLLLGLIREGDGVAAQVLVGMGADLGRVRRQVTRMLSAYPRREAPGGAGEGGTLDPLVAGATATPSALGTLGRDLAIHLDALSGEVEELRAEVARLTRVLREHGIDAGDPPAGAAGPEEAPVSDHGDPGPEQGGAAAGLDGAGGDDDPEAPPSPS